jgi:hypothetical protein
VNEHRPSARERVVHELLRERNLTLERFGKAWRIRGRGVELLVAEYHGLTWRDLVPYSPRRDD